MSKKELKTSRFNMYLTPAEKEMIARLAEIEGGLSEGALIRKLVRDAGMEYGLYIQNNEVRDSSRKEN